MGYCFLVGILCSHHLELQQLVTEVCKCMFMCCIAVLTLNAPDSYCDVPVSGHHLELQQLVTEACECMFMCYIAMLTLNEPDS